MSKKRTKQTLKFLKWIRRYSGYWQLICEPDNEHMNIDMMQSLIKRLAKEEFYEIIFVLLEVHKNEAFIESIKEEILADLLISEWKRGNHDEIIHNFIARLE